METEKETQGKYTDLSTHNGIGGGRGKGTLKGVGEKEEEPQRRKYRSGQKQCLKR